MCCLREEVVKDGFVSSETLKGTKDRRGDLDDFSGVTVLNLLRSST